MPEGVGQPLLHKTQHADFYKMGDICWKIAQLAVDFGPRSLLMFPDDRTKRLFEAEYLNARQNEACA